MIKPENYSAGKILILVFIIDYDMLFHVKEVIYHH